MKLFEKCYTKCIFLSGGYCERLDVFACEPFYEMDSEWVL